MILVQIPKVDRIPRALNLAVEDGAEGSIIVARLSSDVVIVMAAEA